MASLGAGAEDDTAALNEVTGIGSVLDVGADIDTTLLGIGGVAYAEDDATDGATECAEEI